MVFLINRRDENTDRSTPSEVNVKGKYHGCVHNITCKEITWSLLKPLSYMTAVDISSLSSVATTKGKGFLDPVSLQVFNDAISMWTVVEDLI